MRIDLTWMQFLVIFLVLLNQKIFNMPLTLKLKIQTFNWFKRKQ
jgi:hypothetical protein